jgi:5-methylcytosine-specific restriction enzyme subunit McrC
MPIPVQNIYYLLSYAWNRLEERDRIRVDVEDATDLVELFARVLSNGLNQLSRIGLDRGYVEKRESLRVLRGRVSIPETINVLGFKRGNLVCHFEELTHDVLINQIIKATLHLMRRGSRDNRVKTLVTQQLRRFRDVSDVQIEPSLFSRVVIHRNNRLYRFLLDICRLVWRNLLPSEQSGRWTFRDFLRDPRQMGLLFEHFVRNFYRHHQNETGLTVDREHIQWTWDPLDNLSRDLLPQMETDIRLRDSERKILIECKFTGATRINQHDVQRLISSHLYQLNSYLTHLPSSVENDNCEAILLYPSDGTNYSLCYRSGKRRIRVQIVDLSQHWRIIHDNLIDLVRNEKLVGRPVNIL